jgi:hypothetical protein
MVEPLITITYLKFELSLALIYNIGMLGVAIFDVLYKYEEYFVC